MEKSCRGCNRILPLSEFYAHPMMADGHLNYCKPCKRGYQAALRSANIEDARQRDRIRARQPQRRAHRKKFTATWRGADPRRGRAHNFVARHRKALCAMACEDCGRSDCLHLHHPDYNKPGLVKTLCPVCHKNTHLANLKGATNET